MKLLKHLFFITQAFFTSCLIYGQSEVISLWKDSIPGAIEQPYYIEKALFENNTLVRVHHVTEPTLSVFIPKEKKPNGMAIVICPGGGYAHLSIKKEGTDIATWLNTFGVTAFVLKYRLPSDSIMQQKSIAPLQDAQEAIRYIRRNADQWQLQKDKIGIMGFSAGGHLAATLSTQYNKQVYQNDTISARPDFSILIYPVISMEDELTHPGSKTNLLGNLPNSELVNDFSISKKVDKNTPPTFIVHATDDKSVSVTNSLLYYDALKTQNIQVALHLFEKGGHGFGMIQNGKQHIWTILLKEWLTNGILNYNCN